MDFKSLSGCPNWEKPFDALNGKSPREIFNDNQHAYSLANSIILLTNIWDDLIDKDREVSDAEINGAFYCALSDIPKNPFFEFFRARLQPLMDMMMSSYFVSNQWEKERDEHGMEIGHVLRYAPTLLIGEIVCLAQGRLSEDLPVLYKALCGERRAEYIREIISVN